jgi:hypothetical protein
VVALLINVLSAARRRRQKSKEAHLIVGVMAPLKFLEDQQGAHPELAEWYQQFADLYQRKLWHQLTVKLEQFVSLAAFQVTPDSRPLRLYLSINFAERAVRVVFCLISGIFLWHCQIACSCGAHGL